MGLFLGGENTSMQSILRQVNKSGRFNLSHDDQEKMEF